MRDEYRRGEFEARNRQLPADLNQSAAYVPAEQSRAAFQQTPVGTPPSCYDVRSVFDVRPINTYDFHITQIGQLSASPVSAIEMSVPEGYMAILRGVEVWFEPNPTGVTGRGAIALSMQLNGGDYPNNTLFIGSGTNGVVPMYLLADEFNRIGGKISTSVATISGDIYVAFTGNFVLKTGRNFTFEPANPSAAAACTNIPPPPSPQVRTELTQSRAPIVNVSPAAPAPMQPVAPVLSTPAPMIKPPFKIDWTALPMGKMIATRNGASKVVPMQNDRGQRRLLTPAELVQYNEYLQSIWPRQ